MKFRNVPSKYVAKTLVQIIRNDATSKNTAENMNVNAVISYTAVF